jgi:putative endonuclease
MAYYTYILTNQKNGALYTGSTDDLAKRVFEHRSLVGSAFTTKYGIGILVWYEVHDTREAAFLRERQIKEWKRQWKINRINERNPDWRDLLAELV